MIQLQDALIQASAEDVLNLLRIELQEQGINRFSVIRLNQENVQTSCPFHKGGQERKPSFGINVHNGKAHCFTCGWNGDISLMISQIYGYNTAEYGLSWLVRRFSSIEVQHRQPIQIPVRHERGQRQTYITENELDKYRYTHPYMYRRGLNDGVIDFLDIGYDKERECITFPVKDINGDVVFIATRSIKSKFFGLPSGQNKPVYQAYRFTSGKYSEAYIVESFFNCATCWQHGIPAMALMGTGTSEQIEILKNLPVRSYVLALDPDQAGQRATERLRNKLGKYKIIKQLIYGDPHKDINDLGNDVLTLRKTL